MAPTSVSVSAQSAKRKSHTKSRRGCRNCKLRRVKCDETKPHCRTCTTSRFWCNYDFHAGDLEPLLPGSNSGKVQDLKHKETCQRSSPTALVARALDSAFVVADLNSSIELDTASMGRLDHFRTITAYTFAHPKMADIFRNGITGLAFSHPHLMHAMLATSAAHTRYLGAPSHTRGASVPETYHKTQCAALLNQKLSQPIQPEDRDPLWATAATLSLLSLCAVDATSPEEVWPLKSSQSGGNDLDWLSLSEGKMVVWKLVDPLRPGGMFSVLAKEYAEMSLPIATAGIGGIPSALVRLCKLDESSTAANNPYFNQVHALSQFQKLPRTQANMGKAMTFIGHMQRSFVTLLQEKEPVALLILASWYVEVRHAAWWLDHRAMMEGEAICSYLLRYHWNDPAVAAFLLPEQRATLAPRRALGDDSRNVSTRRLVAKA